ncbi:MAG TPA: beta-ketoacyl-[acyl-carrier-protein] synthase family protein [Thermomicrobiales bacterium]|nr:beta-ketoacyl-[acyl-carrier-protein] synthase family protein [Thermomicrobiales bacterium]
MTGDRRRVVITGVGAICGAGQTAPDVFAAVRDGRSAMHRIRHFDTDDFPVDIAAEIPEDLPSGTDRALVWGQTAVDEAVADAFPERMSHSPGGPVIVGSAFGRMGSPGTARWMASTLAHEITARTGFAGPSLTIDSSFASGADAIGLGARRIREGMADIVLAGGIEAPITPLILAGFTSLGALAEADGDPATAIRPFDGLRRGCGLGEGAAFVVLEERQHAVRRGARILAEMRGYGTGIDAFHLTQLPEDGNGLRSAMIDALTDAGLLPSTVDYLNAHGTGTAMNDRIESAVIRDVFGDQASGLPLSSTKAVTGHLLGASGALEAVITILALASQIAPPTINWSMRDPDCDLDYIPNVARQIPMSIAMSNSMGFGGHAASLIVSRDKG